jgi:DNA-binding transcriptional LysR family regulator
MRAFCRIVEVGSFTRAAEALNVAKTTVSGQILGLESLLGVKLLHRTTRRVIPTTDGAASYERARMELDDFDERERAALLWTETLTLVASTHAPDEVYEKVAAVFNAQELAELTFVIAAINAWNRFGVGFAMQPE